MTPPQPQNPNRDLPYAYGGVRTLVLLHERHLRSFLAVWKQAKAAGVALPATDDPSYASLETLLFHVCACARGYMAWSCRMLGLPDPEIRRPPEAATIETEVDVYLEHLIERWRSPLAGVEEVRLFEPEYEAPWESRYCIEAMLEHAVMHPIRHQFQLENCWWSRDGVERRVLNFKI
ncbi:MAG: hypothetical protein HC897_07700 [Thermoanaerobaculia bacterium]|nr:hypothetical protein [Thermoanaerobaculia bacterium]